MSETTLRFAVLIPEFPEQTHAFFWREILAFESLGAEVVIVSTIPPERTQCPHDFAQSALARTKYCWPPNAIDILRGFFLSLSRLRAAVKTTLSLNGESLLFRLKLFAAALQLRGYLRKKEIPHLFVHSFARSALIARIIRDLGGPTYSLCLHGDLEVYGKLHDVKIKAASFCVAVTRPLKEEILRELKIPEDKVIVNSMGVDVTKFNVIDHTREASRPISLITVARINRAKGHTYALQAIEILKRQGIAVQYKIIGTGKASAVEALKEEIISRDISDAVQLLGIKSEETVAKELQNSDIFLLTSIEKGEAAPVSLMEAMASGLPSIVSIIGGTADMIDDGVDGFLVEQKNVEQLVQAITNLGTNRAMWKSIGIAAREKAECQFEFKKRAKITLDAISSCIKGTSR